MSDIPISPTLYLRRSLHEILTPSSPRGKRVALPPLDLGSIDEEGAGYDCGYLNLGAESPSPNTPSPSMSTPSLFQDPAFVQQWAAAGRVPSRRPSLRMLKDRGSLKRDSKDVVDRDCGICFEYAVVPCRTLCCGKIFCTEHLADWLHGPNAEGRCPNCENACSLEGGTLSLAPPRTKPGVYTSSPLTSLQSHQNNTLKLESLPPIRTRRVVEHDPPDLPSSDSASTSSSSGTFSSGEEDASTSPHAPPTYKLGVVPSASLRNLSNSTTAPFSASLSSISRVISIVTFLVFLYRLLS